MVTMLRLVTMDGWTEIARPIGDVRPHAWLFFLAVAVLGGFGLVNLLAAAFVETLLEQTRQHDLARAQQAEKQKKDMIMLLQGMFVLFDEVCSLRPITR